MKNHALRFIFILSAIMLMAACTVSNSDMPVIREPEESNHTDSSGPEPQEPDSLKEPQWPALPTVEVWTDNMEPLSCDYVTAPDGSMGQSITNSKKVCGRMTITQNGKTLYDSQEYQEDISGMTIKIRGNTSAWSRKKPYKIKLQQAADLLERGDDNTYADKEWLLIREGRGQLNTMIGLKISELLGLQWTPGFRYVNLTLNGAPQGLYLLIESVKRKACRLNVSKSGYIIEFDPYWWNEDVWFETLMTVSNDAKFTFKYPDSKDILTAQIDPIKDYINAFDEGLAVTNIFSEYIDTVSFASWLLAQDILGNNDGYGSNIYLTKYDHTKDSKLKMGCLWDFDAIMMTPGRWSDSHWLPYFARLISNSTDRAVANAYHELWTEVKDSLLIVMKNYLESFASSEEGEWLDQAIAADNKLWGHSSPPLRQLINEAEAWFDDRKQWLETAIADIK